MIGICGAGMSAVARLLLQQGYRVTGSDEGFYPPISDYVATLDVVTCTGYSPENIPDHVDLIVIGKNAKLTQDNPEVAYAFEHHRDVIKSFPEVLGDMNQDTHNIVVAGSYGKSTLTSLITWILINAGKDPNYFIGAKFKNQEHSASFTNGDLFVLEGDEYPSANWDDQSKFLHYNAHVVLLTSACHDHVNIYPTIDDYHQPFIQLMDQIKESGQLVACLDEEHARHFYDSCTGNKVSYGFTNDAQWSAQDCDYGSVTQATITHNNQDVVTVQTIMLGKHNVQNIVGAAAMLLGQELVTVDEFAQGVKTVQGLIRRLDRKVSNDCQVHVYEGFGSSYEKARSAIDAMRLHFPDSRLTVVFEPHTFTWRNRTAIEQYQTAFDEVDVVWIHEPPTQGAGTHEQLSLDEIMVAARAGHGDVRSFGHDTWQDIVQDQNPNDVVLLLSAADFDGLQEPIISEIDKQY